MRYVQFKLPNLLKVKEVFETTPFSFSLFYPVLARFSIFWKVFHTQILIRSDLTVRWATDMHLRLLPSYGVTFLPGKAGGLP